MQAMKRSGKTTITASSIIPKLEYVVGLTHTNSIENFWSLFKRGLIGQFNKVSEKHLDRYLDEFTYRFNGRDDDRLFQNTLTNLANGKALTFKQLINLPEQNYAEAR